MKHTFAKTLALVLALTMVLSMGSAFAEGTTVTMWHCQTQELREKAINDAIDRYQETSGNTVEVSAIANDAYKDKIKVAIGADEAPDIFFSWSGGPMNAYVNAGILQDLTPYMEPIKDKWMDAAIAQATYQDKIWAVPVENVSVAMLFYNKKVFEENGLTPPTTLAELEAVADALLEKGIAPFSLANKTMWTGSMWYMYLVDRTAGNAVFSDAANRTNGGSFENPAFTDAGNTLQDMVKKNYFINGFNGLDEDSGQSRQMLYAGRAGMYLMGSWAIATITSENPDFLPDLGMIPFPVVEGGAGDPTALVGTVGDNFYHISAGSQNPDVAFEAIASLLDDQAILDRVAAGAIPPVKGIGDKITDEKLSELLGIVENAKSIQLWYDQYLSPAMSELHKSTSQELFGLTKTPEEVNKLMEDAMAKEAGE
ncbi:extracellular solute-binding protein [Eubacteriales bacterium OttesenSCG-928-N13]|nr:extracellular solute-binding protein [Eubacteriales bacterium OttesenSCG-928-N13]